MTVKSYLVMTGTDVALYGTATTATMLVQETILHVTKIGVKLRCYSNKYTNGHDALAFD
jgi:hypothetical protein